jgi:hypothetical protein
MWVNAQMFNLPYTFPNCAMPQLFFASFGQIPYLGKRDGSVTSSLYNKVVTTMAFW